MGISFKYGPIRKIPQPKKKIYAMLLTRIIDSLMSLETLLRET